MKSAVVTVCRALFPSPVLVVYGRPGPYTADDMVLVLGQTLVADVATMTPSRTQEETVTTTVVFSVFRGGEVTTVQQQATERAYEMATAFADHFKTRPNETLAGACREARVTGMSLAEAPMTAADDRTVILGALAEVTVTLTSKART
ncbi:hypothetical protein KMZ30_07300 [Phycicoccus sp. KQZ13P-1]|uniref:hypothetical protein n=1 Tax=Phycicoccus mangrovi TaxID=2840470 RepID=UPI001C004742|nr:hypothetical protein [Phycicoccus mangrovi]MBT9255377.1 hypothetical protein [Phycicoccus mangrovi]